MNWSKSIYIYLNRMLEKLMNIEKEVHDINFIAYVTYFTSEESGVVFLKENYSI